jgi:hypothetical protein
MFLPLLHGNGTLWIPQLEKHGRRPLTVDLQVVSDAQQGHWVKYRGAHWSRPAVLLVVQVGLAHWERGSVRPCRKAN